ncbi:protein PHYTOCHROME KINASE SUBSTRATE 3-like [Actinidia eriantha]|uniref:protein PHYTOCHROME KINASE SUBSTRATE 3-like n=1 Tax=Actinidia eriantha TaxID=165200 RepID=UPI0025889188|nr:protein PHYTOCHROME KINASE SUBSTRATE 3-like [Actinidia eriantha]
MDSPENYENLRVASFSAYLNSTDENIVLKVTGGIPDPTGIFSPEETPRPLTIFGRSKKSEEGEIGVFEANKYFNMKIDYETPNKAKHDRVVIDPLHQEKPKVRFGAPSVSSEASRNSQAALLPNPQRNPARIKERKGIGKTIFTGFRCNGPCLDKKSVYIDKRVDHDMIHTRDVGKESFRFVNHPPIVYNGKEHFAFPVLGKENLMARKRLEEHKIEEVPRYSIEVFGSNTNSKKSDIATNLERKLSMLTWDAIPKSQTLPSNLGSSTSGPCDDIQSDASSDLFEIETGHKLLLMQESDLCSQYEPSEASIEWSVVTASMVDFSVVTDYDEKAISNEMYSSHDKMAKTKNVLRKEEQKGRLASGLLGCQSHKAVSVSETVHRASEKPKRHILRKDFEFAPPTQLSLSSRAISPEAISLFKQHGQVQ